MKTQFTKRDFLVKDLAVSMVGGSRGATWMPGPDQETPPWPLSPVAAVLTNVALIEAVRGTIREAIETKRYDDVARAFELGDAGGDPVIRAAIQEIGTAVVASAAFAGLAGGGIGLPNPECGGTSLETIPPTLTPIIHTGLAVHRLAELPRLKQQLTQTLAYVEKAAAAQAPCGKEEVTNVRAELEGALNSLSK